MARVTCFEVSFCAADVLSSDVVWRCDCGSVDDALGGFALPAQWAGTFTTVASVSPFIFFQVYYLVVVVLDHGSYVSGAAVAYL